jgi:hypothetical protein
MEECAEVAQRISKALVFGMDETQPGVDADGQPYKPNRERIIAEFNDLMAVMGMAGFDVWRNNEADQRAQSAKAAKVHKYLAYSKQCGKLDDRGVVDLHEGERLCGTCRFMEYFALANPTDGWCSVGMPLDTKDWIDAPVMPKVEAADRCHRWAPKRPKETAL